MARLQTTRTYLPIYDESGAPSVHSRVTLKSYGDAMSSLGASLYSGSEGKPSAITDFFASEEFFNEIVMTWSDAIGGCQSLPIYNLYKGTSLLISDITSPYPYQVTGPFTADFYIRATTEYGSTNSNLDSGTARSESPSTSPSEIDDFVASDDEVGKIIVTFSNSFGNPSLMQYDLYQDYILVQADISSGYEYETGFGTNDYYVTATNTTGSSISNTDSGTSVPQNSIPSIIDDFEASDHEENKIIMTFSEAIGYPHITYRLLQDDVYVTNITPGYELVIPSATHTYRVLAINTEGERLSNEDVGTSVSSLLWNVT